MKIIRLVIQLEENEVLKALKADILSHAGKTIDQSVLASMLKNASDDIFSQSTAVWFDGGELRGV